LIATIESIKIKGLASGSSDTNDFFGITAELIGKARITGTLLPLTPGKDDCLLDEINENFHLVEIGT
ncbi:MAG TPA: hypothetical protein VFD27_04130, partial [Chthoniobacteraceae bacterium]|nr:hypothetical protein [Chthoniobacteraceae bacterium]